MLKIRPLVFAAVLAGCLTGTAGTAIAANSPSVQQLLDQQFGTGVLNASADRMTDGADATWTAHSSASSTMLFEFAGFRHDNVFGVYDPTAPDFRLPLFYGFAGSGADATLTIDTLQSGFRFSVSSGGVTESALFGTSVFGFYLRTPESNVFFSDTALNKDGTDHLWAYQIDSPGRSGDSDYPEGSYLLAWEDLLNGGDKDYQDMVISVNGYLPTSETAAPVPLPAGLLLLGSGLLCFARFRRCKSSVPGTVTGNK